MKGKNVALGVLDLVIWYLFVVYAIYALKGLDVNIWWASLVILVLGTLGTLLCPWMRNNGSWKKTANRE